MILYWFYLYSYFRFQESENISFNGFSIISFRKTFKKSFRVIETPFDQFNNTPVSSIP